MTSTMVPLADLIQLSAAYDSATVPFGVYPTPVNLSAAITDSVGVPTGWWKAIGSTLAGAYQQLGGVPITVSLITPSSGDPGVTGDAAKSDAGGFSWSDGPGGHTTGTNDKNMIRFNADQFDGGFLIQVPCKQWPEVQILRFFIYAQSRRERYTASIDDPLVPSQEQIVTPFIDPGNPSQNVDWNLSSRIMGQVSFSSHAPGRTLSMYIRSRYEFYQGLQAVQLFDAKSTIDRPRGAVRMLAQSGYFGPLGAR